MAHDSTTATGDHGDGNDGSTKDRIDPITELQDGIDGLSLAMFEALRGLRDAVAPESGNLGNNNAAAAAAAGGDSTANNGGGGGGEPDFEEFLSNYRNGDPTTVALVQKVCGHGKSNLPQRRDDFIRIHGRIEMEKDSELVTKLAGTVLEKSDDINRRVSSLPGMNRTRQQQMAYIQQLLEQNQRAAAELEERHATAKERRNQVRQFIKENTCLALGIMEGDMQ